MAVTRREMVGVPAGAALQKIAPGAPVEHVGAPAAEQGVVTFAAVEHIVAFARVEDVAARLPLKHIVAVQSHDDVVTVPGVDRVGGRGAVQHIVLGAGLVVGQVGCGKQVARLRVGHRFQAACGRDPSRQLESGAVECERRGLRGGKQLRAVLL
ncbi:hypothetical protein D9M68_742650 [compost metagenome]